MHLHYVTETGEPACSRGHEPIIDPRGFFVGCVPREQEAPAPAERAEAAES